MIYLLPFFLTIIGIVSFDLKRKKRTSKQDHILCSIILLTLILIIGFRFEVGGDTIAYMGDFQWREPLSNYQINPLDPYQPGYTLLISLSKSISDEFYVFQLIHATIVNTLLFFFIRKNSNYFYSSLMAIFICCYLYFTTEILREVLAVLVFCININSLIRKKWIKYYMGVIIACFFHISAIFLIVLPFLSALKFNRYFLIIFMIALTAMMFMKPLLNQLSSIALISDKITAYSDEETHGMLADLLSLSRFCLFPIAAGYMIKFCAKKKLQFENLIAIMSLLGLASFFNPIIFGRATNYFMLLFCVSITNFCVQSLRQKKAVLKQYSIIFCSVFVLLYGSGNIMYKKYQRWIPYYSIFNPVHVDRNNYI